MIPQRAFRSVSFVRHRWQGGAALALVLALAASPAAAAAADPVPPVAPAPDPALADTGDQVVVTARKTSEKLQDVPVAITAISGADLARNDHVRLEDLNQLVPSANVVITNGHQTSISIRGIGNNPGSDGLENSAGVFLDGVYLGRPGMAATDLIDIKQVEVLRGPQGTLFGRNSTAGLINIVTKGPELDGFKAKGSVSYGNYDYWRLDGAINAPLSHNAALRVDGVWQKRDGYIKSVTPGEPAINDRDRWLLRGQLLFEPTNDLCVATTTMAG